MVLERVFFNGDTSLLNETRRCELWRNKRIEKKVGEKADEEDAMVDE